MSGAIGSTPPLKPLYQPSPVVTGLAMAAILAIFAFLFWSFLERQIRFAVEFQADWGHTLVIPFIAGWFVWLNREKILAEPLRPSVTGLVLVVFGMGWFSLCSLGPAVFRHHNLMGAGVGLTIFGLVLAICGWRAMKWLWFPVFYLVAFSQTISDRFLELLTFELQGIATIGAEVGLSVIGYDVARAGHTLDIYQNGEIIPINIAEACSGMRMLVAFLALGVAMAYRGLDNFWLRAVLVLAAFPTAIFINILRVVTLGILATYDSDFAAGDFHSMVGMLWLIPAFFIYLGIMCILKMMLLDDDDESASVVETVRLRFDGRVIGIFVACVLTLVAGQIGFSLGAKALQIHLQTEPVPLRRSLSLVPSSLGQWRSVQDAQLDAAMIEQLGTPSYLTRMYVDDIDRPKKALQLHIAYYTDQIDAIPHVPDRCLVAGGYVQRSADPVNVPVAAITVEWKDDEVHRLDDVPYPVAVVQDAAIDEAIDVRMPTGEPRVRYMEFVNPKQPDRRVHAGYFFIANGRWRPTPYGVKMASFIGTESHAYYCKVQLISEGDSGYDQAAFFEDIEPFLTVIMPEIMRSLPDWSEVTASLEQAQPK
ncbi:MAG: exosortase/archaeosortase family protein [Phycisphaerales bacterium]|nr:exosortase/archaeosortase family protein [Phycisphaerales bacterium]